MKLNFENNVYDFLKIIAKYAQNQKIRVFFVGGMVRDYLLKIPCYDLDLLIEGNAIEFVNLLPEEIKIISIHKDFCTVKVQYKNLEIDIASSRSEFYPYSGCLPDLDKVGVKIEQDVLRRDFTVNSLYIQLILENNELKYELIDLVGGVNDIKNKVLKVLHKNSYIDDPTRILRGVDFKYRFAFDFSLQDKELISDYLSNISHEKMSISRAKSVLKKILAKGNQDLIFKELINEKYYKIVNKEDLIIDLNKAFNSAKRFNLTHKDKTEFYFSIIENPLVEQLTFKNDVEIYKKFSSYSNVKLAYEYFKTNNRAYLRYLDIKDIKLKINGSDLINLGYPQGKIIGKILDKLLQEKISSQNYFKTKNSELSWVKKNFF